MFCSSPLASEVKRAQLAFKDSPLAKICLVTFSMKASMEQPGKNDPTISNGCLSEFLRCEDRSKWILQDVFRGGDYAVHPTH